MTMNIKIIFCDPLPRLVLHLQGEIVQELIKMLKVQGGRGGVFGCLLSVKHRKLYTLYYEWRF